MPVHRAEIGVELRTRLLWLTAFRVAANTLSLSAIGLRLLAEAPRELSAADWGSLATTVASYGLTLAYSLRLRFAKVGPRDALAQVIGDVLIAGGLVYLTGGAESPFTFTFLVAVIGAALMLGLKGALGAAAASFAVYVGVVLVIQWGWVVPPMGGARLTPLRLAYHFAANGLAVALVATLSGYLSRQLASTGGRLLEREADLRSLSKLHSQILESMPSGLVTADSDGLVTFANPHAQSILGQSADALLGTPLGLVIPGVDALGAHASRRELAVRTPGGSRILGLSVTPLAGKDGVGSVLLVFQDLTELRRLEQELQRADRMAALGQMAAQLAHEIRNPLAAMRGSAQILSQELAANAMSDRLGRILIRESDRLAGLVDDVLRFARPASPRYQATGILSLTVDVVQMLRTDPLAEGVRLDVTGREVHVELDPNQLRQVLLNLVRNGMQAAGRGGHVDLEILEAPREVLISVRDSGSPVPDAVLARFFEPFFSTKQGGTGLGLATAHAIVRAHGGSMSVQSTQEAGTVFTIRLPKEAAPSHGTPVPAEGQLRDRERVAL